MSYQNLILLTATLIIGLFISPIFAHAQTQTPALKDTVQSQMEAASGRESEDTVKPQVFIARIIQVVLGLVGTVFLVLLLMSGYWLVTSRGRSEQIEKARKTALRATVGLIIILLSYSVTLFVTEGIQQAALEGNVQQENKPTTPEDVKGLFSN